MVQQCTTPASPPSFCKSYCKFWGTHRRLHLLVQFDYQIYPQYKAKFAIYFLERLRFLVQFYYQIYPQYIAKFAIYFLEHFLQILPFWWPQDNMCKVDMIGLPPRAVTDPENAHELLVSPETRSKVFARRWIWVEAKQLLPLLKFRLDADIQLFWAGRWKEGRSRHRLWGELES